MPYISKEQVKEKRAALKKALPNFKLSVTTENYSGIKVAILSGPINFGKTYEQVNHFWYKDHYKDRPDIIAVFDTIMNILNDGMGEGFEDSDYGYVPGHYTQLHIGKWDRPYICNQIAGVDFTESLNQLDAIII